MGNARRPNQGLSGRFPGVSHVGPCRQGVCAPGPQRGQSAELLTARACPRSAHFSRPLFAPSFPHLTLVQRVRSQPVNELARRKELTRALLRSGRLQGEHDQRPLADRRPRK